MTEQSQENTPPAFGSFQEFLEVLAARSIEVSEALAPLVHAVKVEKPREIPAQPGQSEAEQPPHRIELLTTDEGIVLFGTLVRAYEALGQIPGLVERFNQMRAVIAERNAEQSAPDRAPGSLSRPQYLGADSTEDRPETPGFVIIGRIGEES